MTGLETKSNATQKDLAAAMALSWDAVHRLGAILPLWAEAAHDRRLKQTLWSLLGDNTRRLRRLGEAAVEAEWIPARSANSSVKAWIIEGTDAIRSKSSAPVRDEQLLAAARRVVTSLLESVESAIASAEAAALRRCVRALAAVAHDVRRTQLVLWRCAERLEATASRANERSAWQPPRATEPST
jgi:hypothetical protein